MTLRPTKKGRIDKLVTFKITLDQYKGLEAIAREEGSTVSSIIRHHITKGIREWEQSRELDSVKIKYAHSLLSHDLQLIQEKISER